VTSFEKRAKEEVERIKAEEIAEQERMAARLEELTEQVRERRAAASLPGWPQRSPGVPSFAGLIS